MTPIYERGERPTPPARGHAAAYIWRNLDWTMRMARPYFYHEIFWGVPCGPTLSMLPGRGPQGLTTVLDSRAWDVVH